MCVCSLLFFDIEEIALLIENMKKLHLLKNKKTRTCEKYI